MTHDIHLPPVLFRPLDGCHQTAMVMPESSSIRMGDHVLVRELLPHRNELTDRAAAFLVTFVQNNHPGIVPGWMVLSLERQSDLSRVATPGPAAAIDAKPAGWREDGEVLEVTPAAIVVQDRQGERHVLTGNSWTAEAQPTDSVVIQMTADGYRLHVTDRPCAGHQLDPSSDRCAYCRLPGSAIRAQLQP